MEPFRFHLFVCTQQKPEGIPSCPASGSFAVLDALDREIQARGLNHDVQLTTCGCMGLCDEGPVMVVYPAGVWYRHVQGPDVSEIVGTHLRDDKPVDRLVWNDAPAMKAMSVEHGEKFRAAMAARDKAGMLPDRLDQMIRGYMPSRCILTALELDLFTAVGDGANAEQIGMRIHANARAAGMLLNALVALGLLVKSGVDYRNTPESARFFVQGSKDNHRNGLLHTANIWHRWSKMTDAVRTGTRVAIDRDGTPDWTRNFIAGMQRNAKDRAPLVVKALGTTGVRRILDLGGGSGAYSIAFAKASPDVQCEILDILEVVPLAAEYVSQAGVLAQVSLRTGDMLQDDFGSGYDIIMLNAICHMFSEEQNRDIFRRARQALAPKGRLVVQDFILNPDKTGPQHAALFSLNMLVSTDAGASYSELEYTHWMKAAGFTEVSRISLPGPSDLIVGLVK
ncbi:MAG: methyltransferase domain-containing protein [Acidobacteriia bacterium]|nr:methyltransferase domain-containing protein [Terriglobia bacterium]